MNIIIGAGISGLSYAAFSNEDYLIIEAESEVGGYCKTTKRNGFVWDYAGHFFHFNDIEIKNYVFDRMASQKIYSVDKITKIKYKDDYIDFPFQKNIHQLEKSEYIECLVGLIEKDEKDSYQSFKEMVVGKFGQPISDKFLIPYNEKLYSTDLNSLDANAMGRFFPYADVKSIILNAKASKNESYNSKFMYPEGGAIEFVKAIASEVDMTKVRLDTKVLSVDLDEKTVELSTGEKIKYDKLINTSPITNLFDMAKIDYDKRIYTANSVLVFNLGFDAPANFDHHWVYFPSKDISFYRIGYYNNILSDDNMSLYIELGAKSNIEVNKNDLLNLVMADLKELGIVTTQNLVDWQFIKMDPAYVHINGDSEKDKTVQKKYLEDRSVYSIGRYGSWTYCSIEDNIIEAKNLVKENEKK
ncbi:FAD-dependent oxidoreductase [Vibrio sp. CUB2]|uniref:protoporphyrinogen/coproporphyrinogen oxidase n=1 Tax=Vibrio sp. CUB2 TaxID=2315233 RepID=UPI00076A5794|nr:FAD-dependent oxidoreductase [Vibrio sp. CUB2]